MKQIKLGILGVVAGIAFFAACKKTSSGNSVSTLQKQVGSVITSDSLCGAIKGTLQTNKTYLLTCPVTIDAGDTVLMQSGVTINVVNPAAYILVQGVFVSLGTKTSPNWITVSSISKTDNASTSDNPSTDNAYISPNLWLGIQCDTSATLVVMKWTHLDFAGAGLKNIPQNN